jgi:hypothetical protein
VPKILHKGSTDAISYLPYLVSAHATEVGTKYEQNGENHHNRNQPHQIIIKPLEAPFQPSGKDYEGGDVAGECKHDRGMLGMEKRVDPAANSRAACKKERSNVQKWLFGPRSSTLMHMLI